MNCYCNYPGAQISQGAGQKTNLVTVYNDTNETVRVYWMGIGWYCWKSTKDGMTFVCYSVDLAPKKAASANVTGYLNAVLIGKGMSGENPPTQICSLDTQITADKTYLVSKAYDCITGVWQQISCQVITKLNEFSGGWVEKILGKMC